MITPDLTVLLLWACMGLPVAGIVGASVGQARFRRRYRRALLATKPWARWEGDLDFGAVRNPRLERLTKGAALLNLLWMMLVVASLPSLPTLPPAAWQVALSWVMLVVLAVSTVAWLSLAWVGMPPEDNFQSIEDGKIAVPLERLANGKVAPVPGNLDLFDAREV